MNDDIKKIIHDLRGSVQSCSGFIIFTQKWLENTEEKTCADLKEYCDSSKVPNAPAADTLRKSLLERVFFMSEYFNINNHLILIVKWLNL